jgi:hypothetical protein
MHADEDIWGIGPIKDLMGMEIAVTRAAMVTSPIRRMSTRRVVTVMSPDRRRTRVMISMMSSRVVMSTTIFMDLEMSDFWIEGWEGRNRNNRSRKRRPQCYY